MFNPKESKEDLNEIKNFSEKEEFIKLFKELENISEDKYLKFKNEIDKKN